MLQELFVLLVFLCVFLLIFYVGRRLAKKEVNTSFKKKRIPRPFGQALTPTLSQLLPSTQKRRDALKNDLLQAGYYGTDAMDRFLAARNGSMMLWSLLFAGILALVISPGSIWTTRLLIAGGVGLIMLFGLPRLVLGTLARSRAMRIQHSIPDALDMITMTLGGGMPIQKAIEHVGPRLQNVHKDLAYEFQIVGTMARASSLKIAFDEFAERINMPDITALSTMIGHTEKLGGNVAASLHDYADSLRESRKQRAEERGNSATIKLLFPVIFCLAPPVYILLLGPAVLELRSFLIRENQPGGVLRPQIAEDVTTNPVSRSQQR